MNNLKDTLDQLHDKPLDKSSHGLALSAFEELRALLGSGKVRAAEPKGEGWITNEWVKKGILLGFRLGQLEEVKTPGPFRFFDKGTLPLKRLRIDDDVRLVPGGSAIREGAYVAKGVICMPPMYVNIGAYVDEGTMIDSHALVGSCAQVGSRVHLSAGAQVGGVLEPVGALPVIIEDEVLVGGNCGVYEGTLVRRRAVLAAGVVLTGGTAVYDTVKETIYRRSGSTPLVIPEGAVVVPGSRSMRGTWAEAQGLSLSTPVIVKYRDAKTSLSTVLEDVLR
jgi:2,3,4,5-tetrahydropyridine-2-carboxylate N-succinyltransferase